MATYNDHRKPPIELRDVQLIWRNFAGDGNKYKFAQEGRRNFCVVIDEETASKMEDEGIRVKHPKKRDEGEDDMSYITVKVSYQYRAPSVNLIVGNRVQELTEETISVLDDIDIQKCDLTVNPSYYEMPDGTTGYSLYLREIYVTQALSRLAQEYAQLKEQEYEDEYALHGFNCNGDCATCPENI